MLNFLQNILNQIIMLVKTVNNPVVDLLDIIIVAFLFYQAFKFMRETRAEQLIKGVTIFIVAFLVAGWFHMRAMIWIMDNLFRYGIVVLVILFQPEIRNALERMGRGKIRDLGKGVTAAETAERLSVMTDAVCKAAQDLQKEKMGALIVIERSTMLGEITQTGTVIDAAPSRDVICNLFFDNSPLHDGAMIIRGDRIYAAGCILPLAQNPPADNELGTRHLAAIGVTEISDAIVVVISEETGIISVAFDGVLERNYNLLGLRQKLESVILETNTGESDVKGIKKLFKITRKGKTIE